jgi:hypothetical protein
MTTKATQRRIKRSFTLDPELLSYLRETRRRRKARSDSEALHLLLKESMLRTQLREIESQFASYYDAIPGSELASEQDWAQMTGPNLLLDSEPPAVEPAPERGRRS